jgi:hypothetical protein
LKLIKKEDDFKVGDWVILKDSYIEELKKIGEFSSNHFIKSFNYPQKIKKISKSETSIGLTMYIFEDFKMTAIDKEKFRIANKKDFTTMKLKNIFLTN